MEQVISYPHCTYAFGVSGTMTDAQTTHSYDAEGCVDRLLSTLEHAKALGERATESGALFTALLAWCNASIAVERINQEVRPGLTDAEWDARAITARYANARAVEKETEAAFQAVRWAFVSGRAGTGEGRAS